ncbi:MAG: HAD-IIIA family hydrolase [Proteobacteria bacterium]|nr:HAD-IIIA family hydrolase [Pseudomonadota bacterium]
MSQALTIKCLILDVDGVLTDGTIWITEQGTEIKRFHIHDGVGIKNLQKAGIEVAIISGRSSASVTRRMAELQIQHVYQGCTDKLAVFNQLLKQLNIAALQTAYMGDDLPDIPVMKAVGLSIAVANACQEVKAVAHWHTTKKGGEGAVREICDRLLAYSCLEIPRL